MGLTEGLISRSLAHDFVLCLKEGKTCSLEGSGAMKTWKQWDPKVLNSQWIKENEKVNTFSTESCMSGKFFCFRLVGPGDKMSESVEASCGELPCFSLLLLLFLSLAADAERPFRYWVFKTKQTC